MQTWSARPATTTAYGFGEGVRWDADRDELLWVDLLSGRLHAAPRADLDATRLLVALDEPLGAFAPCTQGGWLLTSGRGLRHLADDGTVSEPLHLEPESVRMNDAACDLQGRLWAGTTAWDERDAGGALHRVDLDGTPVRVRDDVSVGNGPAFSPDGRTLYLDDSGRGVTLAHDLDPRTGALGTERVLVEHEDGPGDGLTVDDDGFLWVALFGGSAVHRYDPTGRLVGRVDVPTPQVSAVCLARGRLYATTVRDRLEHPSPEAGRLFVADVGATAPPLRPYRGRLPVVASSG